MAQDDPSVRAAEQARALFERGLTLANDGRDAEAAETFERSYGLVPRASTALNWAIVLQRLGKGRSALRALDAFDAQREGASERDVADAAALRARVARLLATLTLRVAPEAARVEIDGREEAAEGVERILALDPGPHVIRVEADGHVPRRLELTVAAGEELSERVELEAIAPEQVATAHAELSPRELRVRRVRRGVAVAAAVAAIAIVAIVVFATRPDGAKGGSTGVVLRPFD